ncbi:AAA family ATPase [Hyphomicrobium sp. xq]|uniref:AAA family ATPase n=1 Tax=Hyphomicrobium album TaxID=2665159 RepID=A0A6I3KJ43_9HYPH|nr:ParA family protein [Hyphomicrobium album]MTD93950.1 AAA family ATPase [Hyphomicrobium album]
MCGWESPDEIAQCVVVAKYWLDTIRPWIEFGLSLAGVGTLIAFGIFVWLFKNCRRDIDHLQTKADELREITRQSIEAKDEAETKARLLERNLAFAIESRAPADEHLRGCRDEITSLSRKVALVRTASQGDAAEFWSTSPGLRMDDYVRRLGDSIPVCLFANQKGGVGKTTLSANLAACYAARGERVLAIDLDYQGSLTSLMLAQSRQRPTEFPSAVDLLHRDELPELWSGSAIVEGKAHHKLDYVSCWYSFEKLERNMEYSWVLADSKDDIRYRLARAILSEHVQNTYERVIIDAPPRMTAGFLNGLCASNYLFVPTVVDHVSAIAVGTFAKQVRRLQPINPILKLAGIVGTMTSVDYLPTAAAPAADSAETNVRNAMNSNENFFIRDAVMRRTQKVAYSTEEGIAYLQEPQTRPMFEALADEVARRAPLKGR